MKQLPLFHYHHLDRTPVLKDVRSNRSPEIRREHCYFLGFKVRTKSGVKYHHGLILADDRDSYFDGVAGEYNTILNQSIVSSPNDISLIFVRNLLMNVPDSVYSKERKHIDYEIRKGISSNDGKLFIVFGRIGDSKIGLLEVDSMNALTADERVRILCTEQYGKDFFPLEVCLAHPVASEFDALFNEEVSHFESLIEGTSERNGYKH